MYGPIFIYFLYYLLLFYFTVYVIFIYLCFQMLMIGILKIIAEENPICLFIDDLQQADSGTLELITMLLTQCTSKLTLILAYRDECLMSTTHPLYTAISSLEQFRN
jgi:predicted ATPase